MSRLGNRWIRNAHNGLMRELDRAIVLSEDPAACARHVDACSRWSVQQHLEHLWLSDRAIVGWLQAVRAGEAESDGSGGPTRSGRLVLWLRMIPRGRGRAPDFAIPTGRSAVDLSRGFRAVRADVDVLAANLAALATDPCTRRHPRLGSLNPVQWMRFAHIHHLHHGKIIEEIIAAAESVPTGDNR